MPTAASILKEVFGYDTFRPMQREVIENVLASRDTLAVMPTGGGKSLCYQVPALLLDGLTVVVSPLISLMKDQVEQLHAAGVAALFLNSTLSPEIYARSMESVRKGEVKLLYVAPETLLTPRLFSLLDEVKVSLFTIDEAHCISEWGHDFRPDYRQLVEVRRRYPKAVCLALTATATVRVREDIQNTLGFSRANEFIASFNRENLYIQVEEKIDPLRQTLRFLRRYPDQSGIIYCFSRRQVDELAAELQHHSFSVRPYHAGLTEDERKHNQEAFIRDDVQIIVATIAFGMGINKPNVRFVLHYDLPKSIEEYYQEIGRAGRDGLPAACLLLYGAGDLAKQRYFINQKQGQERTVADSHLKAMSAYAENSFICRRKPLLNYFGETYTAANCNNCDHCRKPSGVITPGKTVAKTKSSLPVDLTIPAQKFLSCVKRAGESHNGDYIIDVLLGLRSERVLKNRHEKLSTFGIGSEMSREAWAELGSRLLAAGYLKEYGKFQFATLSLTDKALEALVKRLPIQLEPLPSAVPESDEFEAEEAEYNHALFALLRQKRKELADAEGVPPYVIFPDRTLVEMARFYPQKLSSLRHISGVGKVKLERYGSAFLDLLRDYCRKHELQEINPESKTEKKSGPAGSRTRQLVEAYLAGQSIPALATRYGVQLATILNHLTVYVADGNPLRCDAETLTMVSATSEQQNAAFAAFAELGTQFLKPVFDQLDGKVSYDDLKILRFVALCHNSSEKGNPAD